MIYVKIINIIKTLGGINVEKVFEIIEQSFEEYRNFWIDICKIESPSGDKRGVDNVGDYIAEFCSAKGFDVRKKIFEKAGNGLVISMNSKSPLPGIAFLAHMDTVHEKGLFGPSVVTEDNEYFLSSLNSSLKI